MKKFVRFTLLVGVILGLATAMGGAVQEEPVVIGTVTPLTGPNDLMGIDMMRGIDLAVDEINAAGGILRRPVKVIHEDTASVPKTGLDAAVKLVEVDKVPLILGAFSSGVTLPIGAYTNEQGIVQINIASTSPKLREVGPYFFSIMGLDDLMGTELAKFAMEDSGQKTFAVLVPNNPYGIGMAIWMRKTVEEAGGTILTEVRYELFKKDYRAEVEKLFEKDPPAILYTAYGTESMIIHKQAYELGYYVPGTWYAGYITMCTEYSIRAGIPEAVEGVKGLEPGFLGPAAARFREEFKKKYGEYPISSFSVYAYDSMWLAALAINWAGTTDPDAVREALFPMSRIYRGASGGGDTTFDKDGMQLNEQYEKLIIVDGKLTSYK